MALVVNTNVPSIASQRYLMESRKEMETAMERLSSGKRINSAADDAAGLAISERMSTQITGLNMAIRNANDGISLTQTAEGAMQEVNDMLQRMRELALQAVHGVNNSADRESLDLEVQALKAEIDRVAGSTTFNNMNILDGSFSASFQIGYNVGETLEMALASVDTASLGLNVGDSESTPASGTNVLISNRLTETFKFDANLDGAYTTTASVGIYSLGASAGEIDAAGSSFAAGDVVINGQSLGAFDGTALASADGHDIYDLVQNINSNVDNVLASSFNTVVAKTIGDGVVAENELAIKVGSIGKSGDAHYQSETYVSLAASNSMDELVDNINRAFTNDEVVASINSDGKLVLSNDTGAAIYIADTTGTSGAYDGATGFEVSSGTVTATSASGYKGFQGFLKLQSTDGSAIEIEAGNSQLASPGTISDLKAIGFTEITEDPTGSSYTVVGSALTSAQIQDSLGKDSTTGKADLVINGIDIYDDTLTATSNTFQGKLDMINAFSDRTNVVASANYERIFDTSNMTFVDNNTITINGKTVDTGTSLSELVSNINGTLADANNPSSGAVTQSTGITASYEGNNLILRGDNVQNVNIVNNDYEITSEAEATLPAYVSAGTARSMTWLAADVKAGRTLTISVQTATLESLGSVARSWSYTVVDGDTASTVADKFYDLIVETMVAENSITEAFTVGSHISVTGATISFQSEASAGSATIVMGVSQVGAANLMFSAANVDHYGAIKLQSTDGSPIAIDFGDSAREDGELGLVEMNVGDSTYDVNDPTSTIDQITVAAVSGISVATSDAAEAALAALDAALETVTQNRADLGAVQNRLNHTVSNLANVVENTSASQSRILDADFAVEAAALARAQILQQAGTAMLAQANAAPQNVLSLLG
jgi:flagellin